MERSPLRFAFAVHVHQPVGNFTHVFEEHIGEVYLPFLARLAESELLPITLHVSGPIFEWLEGRGSPGHEYIDLIGRLVAEDRVELLAGGFYEPVLAALPREDRAQQIGWMRDYLMRRFGTRPSGMWLAERVWEPGLAADIADAGLSYVLIDDRHFLVDGFPPESLHAPYRTEDDGRPVGLFAIDERLRYLIPFRPAREIVRYLEGLRDGGRPLAVFGDDGEKFGGWPGTRRWVYRKGWLDDYIRSLEELVDAGHLEPVTLADAYERIPSAGLAYPPSASYREMEGWSLFPTAGRRLKALSEELGDERLSTGEGPLVRGGHWRNFLARYPEANRMHKKMVALSRLCRERGDPPQVRRALGRAQCNDAYWHGVFGGLYLPHLRRAVWRNLAVAERDLRRGEAPTFEVLDLDADGHEEVWIHSAAFSAIVSPARGGCIEEHTLFDAGLNCADVLTRRPEAYHARPEAAGAPPSVQGDMFTDPPAASGRAARAAAGGAPSIHERETAIERSVAPPYDPGPRSMLVERVLPGDLAFERYEAGDYEPIVSWASAPARVQVSEVADRVTLRMRLHDSVDPERWLEKEIQFDERGSLSVAYRWEPEAFPSFSFLAPELSIAREAEVACAPEADVWKYPIRTLGKSERGLEWIEQGVAVTPRWSTSLGEAELRPILERPRAGEG